MKKLGFIVEMKDCKDAADLRRWVDLAPVSYTHLWRGIEWA